MKLVYISLLLCSCAMDNKDIAANIKECKDLGLVPKIYRFDGVGLIINIQCEPEVLK